MTITAAGFYGLTLEKVLRDTLGVDLESETLIKALMVTDSYTPAFDTHDFRDDVTNEVTGTGYSSGGVVLTSTDLFPGGVSSSPAGVLTYTAGNAVWGPGATIANAMASVTYVGRGGASSADELIVLHDFVSAASCSNGSFTISWAAVASGGHFFIDYTP